MNQTVDDGYRCSGRFYNLNYSNQRLKRVKKGPTEDRVINSYSYRDFPKFKNHKYNKNFERLMLEIDSYHMAKLRILKHVESKAYILLNQLYNFRLW